MKSDFLVTLALLAPQLAHALEAEPPVESNAVGTVIFLVLFIGFCVGFMWMVWRKGSREKKE